MSGLQYIIDGIPPSNNQYIGRNMRWKYQEEKKLWAQKIAVCCRPRPPKPFARAQVQITYHFPDRRRRDPDNYSGKFLLDGLVHAGIIADDSFGCIDLILRSDTPQKPPYTEIKITETERTL